MVNIKKQRLDAADVAAAAAFFDKLHGEKASLLAQGLFGQYTAASRTPEVTDNVRTLWPRLWPFVDEDTRRSFGVKHARFGANADTAQASAARELIDLVDGSAYLLEETRTPEIDAAIDTLRLVHDGMNNFRLEAAPARQLDSLVGPQGVVPKALTTKYVELVVECFLGNAYGISWAAEPIYRSLLERMDSTAAGVALRTFMNETISSVLRFPQPQQQWREILDIIEPKLVSRADRDLLAYLRGFQGTPDKLRIDSQAQKLAASGSLPGA